MARLTSAVGGAHRACSLAARDRDQQKRRLAYRCKEETGATRGLSRTRSPTTLSASFRGRPDMFCTRPWQIKLAQFHHIVLPVAPRELCNPGVAWMEPGDGQIIVLGTASLPAASAWPATLAWSPPRWPW